MYPKNSWNFSSVIIESSNFRGNNDVFHFMIKHVPEKKNIHTTTVLLQFITNCFVKLSLTYLRILTMSRNMV